MKKTYDTKKLFIQGILSFGRALGMMPDPMQATPSGQVHYTKLEDRRRRAGHEKFKAQCAARRKQRLGQR